MNTINFSDHGGDKYFRNIRILFGKCVLFYDTKFSEFYDTEWDVLVLVITADLLPASLLRLPPLVAKYFEYNVIK